MITVVGNDPSTFQRLARIIEVVRSDLTFFVTAAILPGALYAALFEVINRVAYPPPMYTLMVMLFASSIPGHITEIIVGAIFQVVLFASLNSYLLSRRVVAQPLAVWIPSTLVFVIATLLQISFAGEAWTRQDYAGARASVFVGFAVLVLATVFTLFGYRRSATAAPRWALTVNCLLHCAIVVVLFPYVGELP